MKFSNWIRRRYARTSLRADQLGFQNNYRSICKDKCATDWGFWRRLQWWSIVRKYISDGNHKCISTISGFFVQVQWRELFQWRTTMKKLLNYQCQSLVACRKICISQLDLSDIACKVFAMYTDWDSARQPSALLSCISESLSQAFVLPLQFLCKLVSRNVDKMNVFHWLHGNTCEKPVHGIRSSN